MTGAGKFYDELETRDAATREREQMQALQQQIAHARENSEYFGQLLADVDPASITSREALATLPVTRKSDLIETQRNTPPLGGLNGLGMAQIANIFMSPGPIFEPGDIQGDYFRMGRAMWAAGFRPGDLVYNTFAYHMTPAGHMMESGARAVGCTVFPAGIGNTEMQLEAISTLKPRAYVGTPSFLRILLEKGREAGLDMSSIKVASVGGEALPPSLRTALQDLGVDTVIQSYGTADLGLVAYETDAMEGMTIDEGVIVEIVRPGTGDPVAPGEVGEVVVTTLNRTYPLIRFATGDMSALMEGESACGRTGPRIKGWMGRADQTAKVKGMFVHPGQVVSVQKRHSEIHKVRLVVTSEDNVDQMTLQCEVETGTADLQAAIEDSIQAQCKVRGSVAFVPVGSLANDGMVIEDARTYE
ncbi:phenylacetate--CoA ligase family protein [Sneathiella chinensis]|uniref:Phenylacetate--CoA ligase n=1 Tax=Sneathiella chinensis TaxID=349750 RepID=A0ABQ5U7C6_9PROT|nr:AMP-binding protein [Sneathiella chinensis]GLQ07814.1 phenylacetate--CoA ligase [Sneathiella chinensis]